MNTKPIHPLDDTEKAAVAKQLHALFDHWQLSPAQRLAVMGQSEPFGEEVGVGAEYWRDHLTAKTLERTGHLLVIHASLRTLFPDNIEVAYAWMQTPNKAFAGTTPVAMIAKSGMPGLLAVREYLSQALGQ